MAVIRVTGFVVLSRSTRSLGLAPALNGAKITKVNTTQPVLADAIAIAIASANPSAPAPDASPNYTSGH